MGVWKYKARVLGVKNRCRKPDYHMSDTLLESETLDQAIGEKLVKEWAAKNMKKVDKLQVYATYWTSDDSGLIQWQPFNKEHNYIKTLD